jgi:predicted nucleotidyltransferase
MSTKKQPVSEGILASLFGKTRRSILALLFSHTDEAFHLRKILRLAQASPGAGQRELRRLSDAGVLLRSVKENQVLFQANARCPIFDELKRIVAKTAGLVDILRIELEPEASRIEFALVYGSLGRGEGTATSDVDLLVVGDVGFENVVGGLAKAQDILRREINPLVMSPSEFRERTANKDHLLASILGSPILMVIGDCCELERMAQERLAH